MGVPSGMGKMSTLYASSFKVIQAAINALFGYLSASIVSSRLPQVCPEIGRFRGRCHCSSALLYLVQQDTCQLLNCCCCYTSLPSPASSSLPLLHIAWRDALKPIPVFSSRRPSLRLPQTAPQHQATR